MRRKLAVPKAWPLLHRFFVSRIVSKNGAFCALSSPPSPQHWHHVPVLRSPLSEGSVLLYHLNIPAPHLLFQVNRIHIIKAAMARNLHLQLVNRAHLNFKSLDLSEKTTERAEQTAAKRPWRDTLLSSPGAISADVETQRLFIADTNHHRIIIADGDGKIVDCIGSSPGMEDGTFETAQLFYPASVIFNADRNFLYIADFENHVVRRANLSSRTVSTVSPTKMDSESTMWGRLLRWMGASQPSESEQDSKQAGKCDNLRYPWHLKLTQHGSLLVASHRFENLWVLDPSSGEVTEFEFQDSEVASEEFCRKAIDAKEMEDVHSLILHEMKGNKNPWQISSVTDIVSRVGRLHNKLFFIDTEGQIIRKYDRDTGSHDILHLSNLGFLGFPSWWSLSSLSFQSPNCVNTSDDLAQSADREADRLGNPIHIQPGRCLFCINPILPKGMVWAGPLEDGSILRQAKGSVVDLSMFGGSLISHKISSAQQWIDDLDDLDDPNSDSLATEAVTLPPSSDTGIPLYVLVDATLGTGEVIVDAVLYVKYAFSEESPGDFPGSLKETDMGGVLQERALQDQIFLKQLHIKVRLEIETSAPEERTKHIAVHL